MVNTLLCFVLQSRNSVVRISIILIRHWQKSKAGSQLCLCAHRDMFYLRTTGELHICVLRNELQPFCSLLSHIWHPCNDVQNRGWVTLSLARDVSEMDEGSPGLDEKSMTDSRSRVLYELLHWLLLPFLTLFFAFIFLIRKVLIFFILQFFGFTHNCYKLA